MVNQTIVNLGCGALPIMNQRIALSRAGCKAPVNATNPLMGNNITTLTPSLIAAVMNPSAVCGVAPGAGCANGAAQPLVTSNVALPGLNCTRLTADAASMQSLCDIIVGTANSLVDPVTGVIDDPSQLTNVTLCGVTYDMCSTSAATDVTARRMLVESSQRFLQTTTVSSSNSLSISMAPSDASTAQLVALQTSAGAITDAVSSSLSSLSPTSASLVASASTGSLDPVISSDPAAAAQTSTYVAPSAGAAVSTSPTLSEVAAASSTSATATVGQNSSKTNGAVETRGGGLLGTMAVLVLAMFQV